MAPTLFTACNALHLAGRRSPEASLLLPVQPCASRLGVAGISPEGAGQAGGGPALRPLESAFFWA